MGGNAFKVDGFEGPRIPTALYGELKLKYAAILAQIYENVTSAEAPMWKVDHGDVDMLVEGPRHDHLTPSDISEALGAKAWKGQGPTFNFAMPHPGIPDSIVQLDVQICPRGYFQWQVFQASYSDLAQIIGVIIRGLGLTANDKGLHVRIAEIETSNKKDSLIHLTQDPDTHMKFLGLDSQKFHQGFDNEEDLFHWVAGCRFLNRQNIVPKQDGPTEGEKHNDRARRQKRGMFRAFVEDFMFSNHELGDNCQWDRAKVLHEALEVFGRRQEYNSKLAAHTEQEREKALWTAIRNVIPRNGPSLKTTTRGLLRFVSVHNGELKFNPTPVPDEEKTPWVRGLDEAGENRILAWVQENWETVRVREKANVNAAKPTSTEHEAKKRKLDSGTEAAPVPPSSADGNS
ncbi:uncharacterized protein J3D65DRAFT_611017 [Phyllosticta citribraziliensis]|uniref:Uncharacterized protein n=1 Tax=Phyllosticta citribraziliensis TaxID=989973 RepID=A0ABR1MC85_9PEZI